MEIAKQKCKIHQNIIILSSLLGDKYVPNYRNLLFPFGFRLTTANALVAGVANAHNKQPYFPRRYVP